MPPKRKSRAAQLQPQPADSEQDTDAPTETPTLAPPPQRSNTELNLTVLRRYSPDLERILSIAPFAVVYTFSPESQQWEKCGIEGTLFICQLSGARYNAIILNRKSLDNFILEIVSADDVEITEEYVILQATSEEGTPQIYGIWIFSDGESEPSTREVVAQTIQTCALQSRTAREAVETVGGVNGHATDPNYGMDGTTQMQEQMEEEEAVSQQAGQRLDLLELFASKPAENNVPQPAQNIASAPSPPDHAQPTRFTPSADTDFFRSSQSPALAQQ